MLTLPALIFVFRNRPEDVGQHLDGDPTEHETHDVLHGGDPPPGDPAFTIMQAVKTSAFWILAINMMMSGLVGTALIFHMQDMLKQAGLDGTESQAALAIQPWPIAFGGAMLAVGWLTDRFHPAKILPVALVLQATAGLLCFTATRGMVEAVLPLMAVGMGVYGASQATVAGVANPTFARYFGRTHHGAIRGFASTAIVLGTGGGPWLFAFGFDAADGDCGPVMIFFACLALPLGIAAAMVRKPTPPSQHGDGPSATGLAGPARNRLDDLITDEPDPPGASL